MKKSLLLTALITCSYLSLFGQGNKIISDQDVLFKLKVLESWIESKIAYEGWPGLSIGIVCDQEIIWAKAFGYANVDKRIPSTVNTKYILASNTKQFTAIAIMKLRDEGKLDLNDPAEKYIPWINDIKNPFPDAPKITIRHLLTHTSGLPRDAAFPYWSDYKMPTLEELKGRLSVQRVIYPPEQRWKYSNLEFALLGEIISQVSGMPYTEYIKKYILEALNMEESYINKKALTLDNMATGYGRRMPDNLRATFSIFDQNALTPAAGLVSTVMDIAKYIMWQFRLRDTEDFEILKASTMREMQSVQWIDPNWQMAWGYGFILTYKPPFHIVNHGGHVNGFRSDIAIMKDHKIGIICMTNADDIIPDADLPSSVTSNIIEWVIPEIIVALKDGPKFRDSKSNDFSKYEGKYQSLNGDIQILIRGGELVLIDPHSSNPLSEVNVLKHDSENAFIFESEDGYGNLGEILTFKETDKGEIVSYSLGAFVYKRVSNW
jgi:CubicO group peptidase (beta-lactamase class C family)